MESTQRRSLASNSRFGQHAASVLAERVSRRSPRRLRLGLEHLEPRRTLDGAGGALEQYLTGVELYQDASLTARGLIGSYVDRNLKEVVDTADWRVSQAVAGTRADSPVEFLTNGWGSRSAVGLTSGSDADWEQFSVQWDGFLKVTQAGQRIATASDDGSRMWIDLDHDGRFEEAERLDNGWGRGQGPTTGERSAGLAAGQYAIRIQYYEVGGGNVFALATPSYVPRPFAPTATNPVQVVRVLALDFDPRVPSEGNRRLHEVFNWSDPQRMATQFERDLEWATGGAVDVQMVQWRELDAFPTFTDGFRYNPDEYVQNRRNGGGWHETGTDFYELMDDQGVLPLVNSGAIDEIWFFGDHYFNLLGEAWMAGPNSFFINGPSFQDAGFNRAVAGYGFNYERGVGEMIHNLGHRTENHGQRAFGAWNLQTPVTAWDRFSANYLDTTSSPYGVGTTHVPANADAHYDYGDARNVVSRANDFANYPASSGATTLVGRSTWVMGPFPDEQRDYLNWYFAMMPRNDGVAADGRAANWFKYIWDFNSYEANTGLPRQEDAFGAGPIVHSAGATAYDVTVRYDDQQGINVSTLDVDDIRIVGPGAVSLAATPLGPGVVTQTTAGTARTVTYRLTPPDGAWEVVDNGEYRIVMQANQVRDTQGHAVAAGDIGGFRVAIPDPTVINVRGMLSAGQAIVTHSTFDIGAAANLFDGDSATLARTASINPAVVTLAFQTAQTVTGMRNFFSHVAGNPGTLYSIESADSFVDLDQHGSSYRSLITQHGAVSDAYSTVMLATPATARVFRLTARRLQGDDYVHLNEWELLGTGTNESNAPAATLNPTPTPVRGSTAQFVQVTYSDATGVRVPSLGNGDVLITGPNGVGITATFYDVSDYADGPSRTATYWFAPPGGAWDYLDNGQYSVQLQSGSVQDTLLNAVPAAQLLGDFTVAIPPPQFTFPADLAENNAADWIAAADGATASASDDSSRKVAGQSALRFDTTGGFDTVARYPAPGAADWNLAAAKELHFRVYAENVETFQEGPWVRLNGVDGGYFEYRYFDHDQPAAPINGALGQWIEFVVPLHPVASSTGWRRTTVGSPKIQHVGSVEFHADTWDYGFTLWYDDIGVTDFDASWHYVPKPNDVNRDGVVAPIDALLVINELNVRQVSDHLGRFLIAPTGQSPFLDVSDDDFVSPVDALLVIDELNGISNGEGEGVFPVSGAAAGITGSQAAVFSGLARDADALPRAFAPSPSSALAFTAPAPGNPYAGACLASATDGFTVAYVACDREHASPDEHETEAAVNTAAQRRNWLAWTARFGKP